MNGSQQIKSSPQQNQLPIKICKPEDKLMMTNSDINIVKRLFVYFIQNNICILYFCIF